MNKGWFHQETAAKDEFCSGLIRHNRMIYFSAIENTAALIATHGICKLESIIWLVKPVDKCTTQARIWHLLIMEWE